MITKEELLNGILTYLDLEVIPALPTSGKWAAGTFITIMSSKYNEFFEKISVNPMIRGLGLINDSGLIDDRTLIAALHDSAEKYGSLQISFPIIGTMKFRSSDVEKLGKCLEGEYSNDRGNEDSAD